MSTETIDSVADNVQRLLFPRLRRLGVNVTLFTYGPITHEGESPRQVEGINVYFSS